MTAEKSGVFGPDMLVVNRVLVVDDDVQNCELTVDWLLADGFDAEWHASAEGALRAMEENDFGVVVTDFHMPGMSGGELCRRIVETRWDTPVIVVSGFGGPEIVQEVLRAGAYDFMAKPLALEALSLALRRAFERRALQREVQRLRRMAREPRAYGELHGISKAMQRVYDALETMARSDAAVLISGEVGTGRETLARELHYRSRRGTGPFISFNCAAMPEAVLASNLFGHVHGAFGDARGAHPGLLARADRGTMVLCEVADLPLGLQKELLHALVERKVVPVGGSAARPIDVRIITTTHHDLEPLVAAGSFRADLFHRISSHHLTVPPLRDRNGDVLLLAEHFIRTVADTSRREINDLSAAAAERLAAYDWPGNVRELKNSIERAVLLARSPTIEERDLPQRVQNHRGPRLYDASADPANLASLEEIEKRYILHVLRATRGNRLAAARCLGVTNKTLTDKLEAYGNRECDVRGGIRKDEKVAND